jgi:hypothetical protein
MVQGGGKLRRGFVTIAARAPAVCRPNPLPPRASPLVLLTAEHAGVLEHDGAVDGEMPFEDDAVLLPIQDFGEPALALFKVCAAQILTVSLDQIEGAEHA